MGLTHYVKFLPLFVSIKNFKAEKKTWNQNAFVIERNVFIIMSVYVGLLLLLLLIIIVLTFPCFSEETVTYLPHTKFTNLLLFARMSQKAMIYNTS